MVIKNRFVQNLFSIVGSVLYNANIVEQEQWTPGEYSLATFNFGSLNSHSAFQEIFFNNENFGTHRADYLNSVGNGCDYCFWMIHYRNRQAIGDIPISTETKNHLPKSLDTNLVCMFSVSHLLLIRSLLNTIVIRIQTLNVLILLQTSRLILRTN